MIRKILTASVAGAAIALAGPALAGPGHSGGHGGVTAGANAGVNMGGGLNAHANANANTGLGTNPAAGVSQGPAHASINGIAHANAHSVLASGSVASINGLTTGLTVMNANGTNIGTVSQIVTDSSGNIRLVIVTDTATGQTFRLMPSTITVNGTTVTTTSTVGG
jgi:sporulation protein YlmC with PRC-barrel domain